MIQHPFRNTFLTKHHILAKIRGGVGSKRNLIKLWRDKHNAYHIIFHNDTFREALAKLNIYYKKHKYSKEWKLLFKDLTIDEIRKLLQRVIKIKKSQ